MGKECPECRLVEEEYTRAAAEELTHDALLLKLASLQVLLDKQSHERDSSMTNPDVYEILNRLQTPDAQVLRQAIENLKTERDFERCERFRVDELRSELVFAFGFQVGELRKKRDEWQATAEKAIDASSEGTWMARALDAERELAALREFVGDEADDDCHYEDECPPGARHGTCTSCKARRALLEAKIHVWAYHEGHESCRHCGVVRRADDQNNPCKGITRIEVR